MYREKYNFMRMIIQISVVWLFLFVCLFFYTCSPKKDVVREPKLGERLTFYLDNDKYQKAVDLIQNTQSKQQELPAIAELYYTLMTLSSSCYQTSLRLNQINLEGYLETANKEHQTLLYASKYFLGYTYLLTGNKEDAKNIFTELVKETPETDFLYPRTQLLNAKLKGNKVSQAVIRSAPYRAYNLGFNPEKWGIEFEESQSTSKGSQLELEQAIAAWRLQRYDYLNRLFNNTLAPTFSYQIDINDTLTVKMYNPESLLLTTYYYQYKLEEVLAKIKGPENKIYKYYLEGRLALHKGEYELAANKFATIIQQKVLSPRENEDLQAIQRALIKENTFDEHYPPTTDVFDPELIPAVKYWFYKDLANYDDTQAVKKFFQSVDILLQPIISREDITLPAGYDLCDFKELLYIVGLYFLNQDNIDVSEPYFYHLYHFTESFYPHKNPKCGITYEYQPSTYLVYASLALIDHPRLKRVVLQALKNESVTNAIYRIPSEILSNIHIAPNLTGSNPQN